jgi:phosphatidylglycerol:prolipoprotein diacylglycerol transferase
MQISTGPDMLTFPEIDPVIFSIGFIKVRWYGLMYVIGFIMAWWLARVRSRQAGSIVTPQQVDDLIFYGMLGVILGGRIGYTLFYAWDEFTSDPLYIFRITQGGMSFHGGVIGVSIALWLYGRKIGRPLLAMTDFASPLVPLGLGFGRIGNFINGELWGKPTDVPWSFSVNGTGHHPSQLYEALLEGLVLFIILWTFSSRPRPYMAVTGMFLLFYGIFRSFVEFFREPDADIGYLAMGWLTMGQLLSLPMIVAGAAMLFLASRRAPATAKG